MKLIFYGLISFGVIAWILWDLFFDGGFKEIFDSLNGYYVVGIIIICYLQEIYAKLKFLEKNQKCE